MLNKTDESIFVFLNENYFKAVQLKGSGAKSKVSQIAIEDVTGLVQEDLLRIVQSSIKKFNSKNSEIVYVIPSGMATTKNVEIPSVNAEEIKSIVNLQASRHTPFSREEIQIGFINAGVYKTSYTKVLLVIANRTVLKKSLDVLDKVGLKIRKVLFAPEGVAKFYTEILGLQNGKSTVGIVDIDKTSTDFSIISNGVPIFSRGISFGSGDSQKLIDELTKTMESYKAEDIDQLPSQIILTTSDTNAKILQTAIRGKLGFEVAVNPYIDHVKFNDGVLEQLSMYSDQSILDLIAAASVKNNPQVNLIPEEIQLQKTVEDQGQEFFKTTMLGLIILVVIACSLGLKWYFSSAFLTKLKTTYEANSKKVADLKSKSLKTNIVQSYVNDRMMSLDVINDIYRNIPNEIYLTNLLMDENGNISLQGISDVPSLVFNLGTSLKESVLFKSVEIKSTTAKKDRGKDVSAFEITLKLKSAVEEEKTDAKVEVKK